MLEYVLIFVFIVPLLKILIAFFSQYNFFVGFLHRFLVLFSFFILFAAIGRTKTTTTAAAQQHKILREKPGRQTQTANTDRPKKLIAFHSAHAHMCDDCL